MKKVINIINFIRGDEPRMEMDLVTPVKEQLRLINRYGLKATFLFEYDALCRQDLISVFDGYDKERIEIGGWFEIVRQQVEAVGLTYRGREGFNWDHYANVGTPMGYPVEQRLLLVDEYMRKFREVFGTLPKSMGAWAVDCVTLAYMKEKYGIDAFCICKDQTGTDGYNFSGGYYAGGYYPSRFNMFTPAQSRTNQIDLPVFRMLGSDIVSQYYCGLDENMNPSRIQGVLTLEPVNVKQNGGGSDRRWVDWFLNVNYAEGLNFAYCQAGQENSFGWDAMKEGLSYQFPKIAEDLKNGKYEEQTLSETGRWFRSAFEKTPPTSTLARTTYQGESIGSCWYENHNYRTSFYFEHDRFLIRDLFLFRENYEELYLKGITETANYYYDNLPFIDGYSYSGDGTKAGLYLFSDGEEMKFDGWDYSDDGKSKITVSLKRKEGTVTISADECGLYFTADHDFSLCFRGKKGPEIIEKTGNKIRFSHRDFHYEISVTSGLLQDDNTLCIDSQNKEITLRLV